MKKKLFLLIAAFMAMGQSVFAYDFSAVAPSGQTLYYNYNSDDMMTVELASGYNSSGALTIPASVVNNDGYGCSVTSIGYGAFFNCSGLTSVTIPNSVTSIGNNAFQNCSSLTSVTIGNSVISIGNYAFQNCSGLTTVTIGNSVTSIGNCAFNGCSGLTSVAIPNSVISIGQSAFRNCSGLTSITIGNSVTSIGEYAFQNCSGLTTVTIGNSVTSIGDCAFYGCSGLTSVTIGNSVTSIGNSAFYGCSDLTSVTIGNSVTSIGNNAFYNCSGLALSIPNSVTSIGNRAFNTVRHIEYHGNATGAPWGARFMNGIINGDFVYSNSTHDTLIVYIGNSGNVTIPNSVTCIGSNAFKSCSFLQEIVIPPSVTSIGKKAFGSCSGLKKVYYNATTIITDIYDTLYDNNTQTFVYNVPQTSFNKFPDEQAIFSSDMHIDRLEVGEGVQCMGAIWMEGVDTLVLPSTLEYVVTRGTTGNLHHLIYNCKNLKTIWPYILQNETVGTILFSNGIRTRKATTQHDAGDLFNSALLQHVVFGDSVQTIPSYAFGGCIGVQEFIHLQLPSTVTSVGSYAFENCIQILSAVIPATVTHMGGFPFVGCKYMNRLEYNANAQYYGDADLPYHHYVYNSGLAQMLSFNNVAHFSSHSPTSLLSEVVPQIDTLIIGENVTEIPPCLVGYPMDKIGTQTITYSGQMTPIYIDNRSTNLRRIGNSAFARAKLQNANVLITDSLKYIGDGAFLEAWELSSIHVPEGCQYIGAKAFYNCQNLDSLWLPESLESIGSCAFYADSSLSYLYYNCDSLYIDNYWPESSMPFARTISLHSIDFGPNVRHLTKGIFTNAERVERLVLPEGLISVGDNCFAMNVHRSHPLSLLTTGNAPSSPIPAKATMLYNNNLYVDTASLNYVSFPTTLQHIGSDVFIQRYQNSYQYFVMPPVTYIDTIVCRGAIPATMGTWCRWPYILDNVWYYEGKAFPDTILSDAVLIVPCGTINTYQNFTQQVPAGVGPLQGSVQDQHYNNYEWHSRYTWGDFQHIEESLPYDVVLTVNVDTMGTASWTCATGGNLILTATPADHHHFICWNDGNTSNPRTITVTSDTALQAQFAWGNLYQITALSANNSRGSATGSGTYLENSVDTLVATANYGYHFDHWNDGDTSNPRLLTVTATATYTATFLPNQYILTVSSEDTVNGFVSGSGSYNYNTTHTMTATPTTGYHFTHWNDGNTSNPRNITITRDTAFVASFAINIYTLTVTSANAIMGSAAADTSHYEHGDTAIVVATPQYGYHFDHWNDGNIDNPRQVAMTQNKSLTAVFSANTYSLAIQADSLRGSVVGGGSYDYLYTVQLTATANYGYHFSSWSDGNTDNPRIVTLTQDTSFSAIFDRNEYQLTLNNANPTMGTVSGGGTFLYLDTAHVAATANEHHHLVQWSDGNHNANCDIVVTADLQLTASFAIDTHTVSVASNDIVRGTVTATGTEFSYGTPCTVTATAYTGYTFQGWSNGQTANPYTFAVLSDVELTALFVEEVYTVTVASADPIMGTVSGGGQATDGGTLTICAAGNPSYHFLRWNDNNTDSVRTVVVHGDVTYTAYFEANASPEGIDDAEQGFVRVWVKEGQIIVYGALDEQIKVFDIMGREIRNEILPSGVYMVKVGKYPARKVVVIR